ncbi:hypothetical protein EYF80_016969 [Liparis tanakae]|uniref:Uncharacterized protein n=1 Tax=Liparis tanakae TaxID=230148 RepID=A0A4Z2I4H2_9TELE|nr:hypothetical protein EYF80_016969 [Liparis tanakae]
MSAIKLGLGPSVTPAGRRVDPLARLIGDCKRREVNKERKPGMEWASLRGLLAPFSGEALPEVDDVLA